MGCGSSTGSPKKEAKKQPRKQYTEDQTDIEVKKVNINKGLLERYIELEKQARPLEEKNVLKRQQIKQTHLDDLEQTIKQLDDHHKKCAEQTKKEKADVDKMNHPDVKSFFKDQATFDSKLSKEQEEYVEALNKEEVAKKELDGVTKQRDTIKKEVDEIKGDADKLQAIYKEQDELLASLFNGKYGSQLEYKLESEMDVLLDKRQRIIAAKYRWQNARVLVHHGCQQLGVAVKNWEQLPQVDSQNAPEKYRVATICRNNLVASNQNLSNAQRYLKSIKFPYCTAEEMETLTKATNNIYTDMQTEERQKHSMECYTATHKRCLALLQWMDQVIDKTISKDLTELTISVNSKEKELRAERLRVIKEKIKAEVGDDVDLPDDAPEERVNQEQSEGTVNQELFEADQTSLAGDVAATKSDEPADTPMSLDELAPPPSTDDLFGDIEEVKKQHEEDMEEYEKAQELNRARMEQGLEEKLRARRSRRLRQEKMEGGSK